MCKTLLRLVAEEELALHTRGSILVPQLTPDQLLEIRAICTNLEARAAAAAADRRATELDELKAIHAQISQCYASCRFTRAVNLNLEFYLALFRLGDMLILYKIVELLWVRCGPILLQLYDYGVPDHERHSHQCITDALHRRDTDAARDAIREDIERSGSDLFALVRLSPSG